MQPIIYDVAVSIDGFIAGRDGDISGFAESGPVVDDYLARLETYACAIMGRATYEFGYRFGVKPGDNPYPHMDCHVLSQTLTLPAGSSVELVREPAVDRARRLKTLSSGPIYLCGGGRLAGSLMEVFARRPRPSARRQHCGALLVRRAIAIHRATDHSASVCWCWMSSHPVSARRYVDVQKQ